MSRVGKSCSVVQDENHGQGDRNKPVFHVSTPHQTDVLSFVCEKIAITISVWEGPNARFYNWISLLIIFNINNMLFYRILSGTSPASLLNQFPVSNPFLR